MKRSKKAEKYDKLVITTLVMLVFSVFLIIFGATFALYRNFLKGTTNNVIQAGVISFSYDESVSPTNGINIQDALPKADSVGKIASGANEYFDFSINAESTISNIPYQIYVLKQDSSTLDDDYVKVYLTLRNGTNEIASPLVLNEDTVKTYSELSGDEKTKLVYSGTVAKGSEKYHQDFRLRLWVREGVDVTTDYANKSFSVKVKVTANEAQ